MWMGKTLKTVESHTQWQEIQEVWVGGVYPDKFFEHFDNQTEDIFCYINELSRNDFLRLGKKLEELGVNPIFPEFTNIDDYLDDNDNLIKPPVTPCDFSLTIGDTLYVLPQYPSGVEPYQHAIDEYKNANQNVVILDREKPDPLAYVEFPSVVRAGRDIFIDYDPFDENRKKYNLEFAQIMSKNYRVHLSTTGDHSDGVFCPLKPGEILSSHYQDTYRQSFPGWNVFFLSDKTEKNKKNLNVLPGTTLGKWWLPGADYAHFNPSITKVANQWLGAPEETIYDVNNLVIDENNIITSNCDDKTYRYFESIGMTPHIVNLKTKMFYDAGIHCFTSDIYRAGTSEDYWPDRGKNGIYEITEWI